MLTAKYEKVYLSFHAFGIFDYKDLTTSTSTLCFDTSEQLPHRHVNGSVLTWMECLVTDSTVIAIAAYLEAEAIRTGHGVHRTVVGSQSSGASARLVLSR